MEFRVSALLGIRDLLILSLAGGIKGLGWS